MTTRPESASPEGRQTATGRLARDLQLLAAGVGTLVALLLVANLTVAFVILRHVEDAIDASERHSEYATAIDDATLNAKAIANHERGYMLSGDEIFVAEIEMNWSSPWGNPLSK